MKMFVGLGNPGPKYTFTRHNVGFLAIDAIANHWDISLNKEKFKGIHGVGQVNGEKVILVKPLTYMNLSGECVRPLMDFYKIDLKDVIIIYDDLDLPTGKLRLRQKGSAGGHNGMKSLIQHFGTQDFNRIRIGISRPIDRTPVVDYVLNNFTQEELDSQGVAFDSVIKACDLFCEKSFLEVMNHIN